MSIESLLILLAFTALFVIIMLINMGCVKKNEMIRDQIELIKRKDPDAKLDNLNKHVMDKICREETDRGKLRIVDLDDLAFLIMISLKHVEITNGKAAALLGVTLEDMQLLHQAWHQRDYKLKREERLDVKG